MLRMVLLSTVLCAVFVVPANSQATVLSTQQFEATYTPAASPPTGSSQIGSGPGFLKGLGLDEDIAVKLFASGPSSVTMLVTGSSPLIIREVVPMLVTNSPDPAYGVRLTAAFPRNLQSPAPGVIAAMVNLDVTFPAQVSNGTSLFFSSGCSGSWGSRVSTDYTDTFDGGIDSSQQAPVLTPCPNPGAGAMTVRLRPYFSSINADLSSEHQFAPVNMYFDLPKNISTGLLEFPRCDPATVFANEALCAAGPGGGGPAGQGTPGPTGPPGPPGPAGKDGKDGKLVVVAYQANVSRTKVTVSYALTGNATVTLRASRNGGKSVVVSAVRGRTGLNKIVWNRRINGKPAKRGRYKLSLSALDSREASSLTVTLK